MALDGIGVGIKTGIESLLRRENHSLTDGIGVPSSETSGPSASTRREYAPSCYRTRLDLNPGKPHALGELRHGSDEREVLTKTDRICNCVCRDTSW